MLAFTTLMVAVFAHNTPLTLLFALIWLLFSWRRNDPFPAVAWGMIGLVAWITLHQLTIRIGTSGWYATWVLMLLPISYIAWSATPQSAEAWRRVKPALVFFAWVMAGWAIQQVFLHGQPRAQGPLTDPNNLACLLNLLWFALVGSYLSAPSKKMAGFYGSALIVMQLALLASGSRAGLTLWLMANGILLGLFFRSVNKPSVMILGVATLLNCALYYFLSSHALTGSYAEAFDVNQPLHPSSNPRFLMWQSTLSMWLQAPWFGQGLGSWTYAYPQFRNIHETGTAGFFAHNDYLQLLQEGGLTTLLFFVAAITLALVASVKAAIGSDSAIEKLEKTALLLGVLSAMLHASVNFTYYIMYLSVLMGIMLAEAGRREKAPIPLSTLKPVTHKIGILLLTTIFAINLFHAFLSFAGLVLLQQDSKPAYVIRYIFPGFNAYTSALMLSELRPGDSLAQSYVAAYIENALLHNRSITPEQHQAMLNEVQSIYHLLAVSNPYAWSPVENEAKFLMDYDAEFGKNNEHLAKTRDLLTKALQLNPYSVNGALLLSKYYSMAGDTNAALSVLAAARQIALVPRDKILIESEMLRYLHPGNTEAIDDLQLALRGIDIHCFECREESSVIRKVLDLMNRISNGEALPSTH